MVACGQFTVVAVHTAVFTPSHGEFNAARLLAAVFMAFPERFQGQLQALPMPADVPPEIPRVVLQSPDKTWKLEAGPARISSFWKRPPGDIEVDFTDVVTRCCEVPEAYVRESNIHVGRLGLLVTRICRVEDPARVLIERFCSAESQVEPFNRSANFEIHNHKAYTPQRKGLGFPINSWVRCKTAVMPEDGGPSIVVEQDLNTLTAEIRQRRFDMEQIRTYFQASVLESEEVFRKYFSE